MENRIHPIWLPGLISVVLVGAMAMGTLRWIGNPAAFPESGDPGERAGLLLGRRVGAALAGIAAQERTYWISRKALTAPRPNPDAFGASDNPAELDFGEAEALLGGQELFFSPDTPLLPGTQVQYYQDETILAITWKQALDGGVYTFSEVKIAHPSQFRRFLAGGEFGSDKLFVTTEMARSVNAVVASSGDFYNYRQAGTLVYDGQVRRIDDGLVDTCYVDKNGDLLFTDRRKEWSREEASQFVEENGIQFSIAFGPVLIRDGETVTPDSYAVGEINDHYPRSALCQLGKLHYLLAVVNHEGEHQTMPTIHRFAENLKNMGIRTAYALDGGQTAVISMNGELTNSVLFGYQRRISDIVYFGTAIPEGGSQ